jgi:hypothetical protein
MQELISSALRRARPDIACEFADGPQQALSRAITLAGGGPALFLYEKLATAHAVLDAIGAAPWPDPVPAPADRHGCGVVTPSSGSGPAG